MRAARLAGLLSLLGMVGAEAGVARAQRPELEAAEQGRGPPEPRAPPLPAGPLLAFDVGGLHRYAYRESMVSLAIGALLGAQNATWGGGARLDAEVGSTVHGLTLHQVGFGPGFHFAVAPRLQMAVGQSFGLLWFDPYTRSQSSLFLGSVLVDWLVGLWAQVSYDIARPPIVTLFLALRLGFDFSMHDSTGEVYTRLAFGLRNPPPRPLATAYVPRPAAPPPDRPPPVAAPDDDEGPGGFRR